MTIDKQKLFPKIWIYANSHGSGQPIHNADGTPNVDLIGKMSRFHLLTLNVTPFCDDKTATLQLFRNNNPNIKLLAYSLAGHVFPNPWPNTFWGDMWRACSQVPNGLLYDINGNINYASLNSVNFANPAMNMALSSLWINKIDPKLWEGLFLDCYSSDISWANNPPNIPCDFKRAGFDTAQAMDLARREQMKHFVSDQKLYGQKIIVDNGTTPLDLKKSLYSGSLFEGWPYLQGGIEKGIQMVLAENLPFNLIYTASDYSHLSQEWFKEARVGLASSCITDSYYSLGTGGRSLAGEPSNSYLSWWMDEFSVTPYNPGHTDGRTDESGQNTGWLGEAVGPAYKDITGCYIRKFPYGLVILNGTSRDQIVDLQAPYWRRIYGKYDPIHNNGKTEQHVLVPGADAVFMLALRHP